MSVLVCLHQYICIPLLRNSICDLLHHSSPYIQLNINRNVSSILITWLDQDPTLGLLNYAQIKNESENNDCGNRKLKGMHEKHLKYNLHSEIDSLQKVKSLTVKL